MLPKTESAESVEHQRAPTAKTPLPRTAEKVAAPVGKVSAARTAVQQFLASELDAREIRIIKIAPLERGNGGWQVEAEILVPNLQIKMLGLPLTQEVLQSERYSIELETDLNVRSYRSLEADED
jgi:hypothetical protein